MPTENLDYDSLFSLLINNTLLTNTEKDLIVDELKNTPKSIAYFLWKCTLESTDKIETVINRLIELNAFNEITINQTYSISQKFLDKQQIFSVPYLLISNAEGRNTLKENELLRKLIGKYLSLDILKQCVHKDTHDGTLYYLLTDELGKQILKQYTILQENISKILDSDKTLLSKEILDGPHKGQSFGNLYEYIFPNSLNKTISPSFS